MSKYRQATARRLVGVYLLAGLMCAATIGMLVRSSETGRLSTYSLGLFCASLLGLIILGTVMLRRAPRMHAGIESQLEALSSQRETLDDLELQPIVEQDEISAGWNELVRQLERRSSLSAVEKRIDEKLAKTNGNSQTNGIVDNLPYGIAVTNADGRVGVLNDAFRAMLHLDSQVECAGMPLAELLPLEVAGNADVFEQQAAEPFRPVSFEISLGESTNDGVLRVNRIPRNTANGTSMELVWTLRDITQQKLSELAKSEFVDTATHELRTPLTNIRAYAEMLALENDVDPEEQKKFLNILNSEATRLSRFVDELLDVNKMEAGSMSLHTAELDVLRMLDEVVEKVRPQMTQQNLQFDTNWPAKLPKLVADKDKLAACFVNLLGNAAKYTPEHGSVTFAVEFDNTDLRFVVKDTGIGIADSELPRVFDKFFRSDDVRVRDIPGSGLGLAFCQETVRLHGGELTVRSEENRGSEFTVTIPIPALVED